MNLQPFTIEAYERGEEVVYRNGSKPDEIHVFKKVDCFPIRSSKDGEIYSHQANGNFTTGSLASAHDLMIKPATITKYRNEYESGIVGAWKKTMEECKIVGNRNGTNGYDKAIALSKGEFVKDTSKFMKLKLISIEIVKP